MGLYSILLYGIPALVIATTLYTGLLGFKFYVAEVLNRTDG
ncbi:hypothetical protein [Streptomyces sp. WMMB 322]|nr:hypothetical protein [Streptomyces sp. WMMB 322]SCK57505.1 hypothetical protein H180DRAFT_05406 [Streptomyces sp. WMMB 322]